MRKGQAQLAGGAALAADSAPAEAVALPESVRAGLDRDLPFNLYARPGHLVRRLHQIAVSIFLEETRAFRITPVQYAALTAIRAHPGVDQRQLARIIAFDRSTIGSVVERLEKRGLIAREVDRADRRYKELYLAPDGAALLREMQPAVERVQDKLLAPLTPERRADFLDAITTTVKLNNELSRAPLGDAGAARPRRRAD